MVFTSNRKLQNIKNHFRFNLNYKIVLCIHCKCIPEQYKSSYSPDIQSLLLKKKIIYLGLPLSIPVTELIIMQILWINSLYSNDRYNFVINTTDTSNRNKKSENFIYNIGSILDLIKYSSNSLNTLIVGKALGTVLLLNSYKSNIDRYALPNSLFCLPNLSFIKYNETINELLIEYKEINYRNKFLYEISYRKFLKIYKANISFRVFTAETAKKFGLIDSIIIK